MEVLLRRWRRGRAWRLGFVLAELLTTSAVLPVAAAESEEATDPLRDALFSDPNCTQSPRWSAWRERMHQDPGQAMLVGQEVAEELGAEGGGNALPVMLDTKEPCMLGAATVVFMLVLASWLEGRFVAALASFATLHDQFLTHMHPHFYDLNGWPMRDSEIRSLKDQLLFNVRKFRALAVARSLRAAALADDPREHENLLRFSQHWESQRRQREQRLLAGALSFVPVWEPMPEVALGSVDLAPVLPLVAPGAAARTRLPRVFMYDESLPSLGKMIQGPAFCHNRQWGVDVGFHDFFRTSPLRTLEPDEADFFFVPAYAICLQVAGILDLVALRTAFQELVQQLPFFDRTRGRDHIFSLHYVDLFAGWRDIAPLSIFLTPETEVGWEASRADFVLDPASHPPFNPFKDIAVPCFMSLRHVLRLHRAAKPVAERQWVAAFAGKLWADVEEARQVRGRIRDRLGEKPGVVVVVGDSVKDLLAPDAMAALMGNARFCLVPRGRAAWSVRFFETLWAGCVPVLLSDHYEVPFDALFDVSEFVIKWPVQRIDDSLYEYLAGLPLQVVEGYIRAAELVRCWYLYPPAEVSWLGNLGARTELEEVESELCPNLSSSRNAFQAISELLARRVRTSKTAMGTTFYWPDAAPDAPASEDGSVGVVPMVQVTDAELRSLLPL